MVAVALPRRSGCTVARLRVATASEGPGRVSFVLLVLLMLSVGLAALLGVNTALAQGSFVVNSLQRRTGELADRGASLQEAIARSNSPDRLAADARRLGMVPAPGVAYIRLADGSISGQADFAAGEPVPATPEQREAAEREAALAQARAQQKAAAEQQKAAAAAEAARVAAARAAKEAAAAAWQQQLTAQESAGPRRGGVMVVAPPRQEVRR